jgi:hypothetical protein
VICLVYYLQIVCWIIRSRVIRLVFCLFSVGLLGFCVESVSLLFIFFRICRYYFQEVDYYVESVRSLFRVCRISL